MAGKTRNEASTSRKTTGNHNNGGSGGGESTVVDCGLYRSSCGYCKSSGRTSVSHGLLAQSLTVNDYQDLLDRGWRRSGSFLYKPEMGRACCPHYTIRLRAGDFVASKEQLRMTRRLQRFLDGNLDSNKQLKLKEDSSASEEIHSSADARVSSSGGNGSLPSLNVDKNKAEKILQTISDKIDKVVCTCVENGEFPDDVQLPKATVKKVPQGKRKLHVEGSETLLYSSNIAFQIAAAIRKHSETGTDAKEVSPKNISEKLASSLDLVTVTFGLSVKACNGHINFYSDTKQVSVEGRAEISTLTEESAARRVLEVCSSQSNLKQSPVKRRRLEIHLKRSGFDPEEYALFRRYQIKVHNDKPDRVTEASYNRFLVDTPLIYVPPTNDGTVPPCGFGSFHQQYVIDGQLVAVGVIDILPRCLSSKYLFWDPDFAFLSLGKYSALQEVNWIKENQTHCPSLEFYYLGYYIHSCNKMRYKATYRPSELLCPLRYQWVSFGIAKPFLDKKEYVILTDCTLLQDGESSAKPNHSEQDTETQHDGDDIEDCIDVRMHGNEEGDESSDGESDEEFSDLESIPTENGDLSNVLIELYGKSLKYKDVQRALLPEQSSYLDGVLQRYLRVVGKELSESMIYSLR